MSTARTERADRARAPHRPGQTPRNWLGMLAVPLGVLVVLVAACGAGPQPPAPAAPPPHLAPIPLVAAPCAYPDTYPAPTFPNGKPIANTLSPSLVRLSSEVFSDDGDMVHANAAILDAVGVAPAPTAAAGSGEVVALLSFTVKITAPGGWDPSSSLMLIPYERTNGTTLTAMRPICPDQDQDVLAAMGATGHPPLPPRIEPGQTVTGWAAFRIPRDSSALTLLMLRRWHDGYMASESALLKR